MMFALRLSVVKTVVATLSLAAVVLSASAQKAKIDLADETVGAEPKSF